MSILSSPWAYGGNSAVNPMNMMSDEMLKIHFGPMNSGPGTPTNKPATFQSLGPVDYSKQNSIEEQVKQRLKSSVPKNIEMGFQNPSSTRRK